MQKAEIFDLINSDIGINAVVEELESYTSNKKYYMKIASDYVEITKEQYDLLDRILRREKPTEGDGLTKLDRIIANYHLIYKKLTSKDEHCPICGNECKTLYDGILDSYGANARYCSHCDHIFYIGEKPEEKDEKK